MSANNNPDFTDFTILLKKPSPPLLMSAGKEKIELEILFNTQYSPWKFRRSYKRSAGQRNVVA